MTKNTELTIFSVIQCSAYAFLTVVWLCHVREFSSPCTISKLLFVPKRTFNVNFVPLIASSPTSVMIAELGNRILYSYDKHK